MEGGTGKSKDGPMKALEGFPHSLTFRHSCRMHKKGRSNTWSV